MGEPAIDTTLYRWKVRALKRPWINLAWKKRRIRRGEIVGDYGRLPDIVRGFAAGRSFADIGCMWGVNGEYSFVAEEAGAVSVKAVDVFGPTPEFEAKHRERDSSVEFVLGDVTQPETFERIGAADVVLCAGVLYHHPSPFDLLVALRHICSDVLILRTASIPEFRGMRNLAVYWPLLPESDRRLWDLRSLGLSGQTGITTEFAPGAGYANWFWGMTPTCLVSLVETAGFRVEERQTEPFAQTFICRAAEIPFRHRLPSAEEARATAEAVSAEGIARPA